MGYHYFPYDAKAVLQELGKERILQALEKMLLIRNLEVRGEAGYQQGKVGGFYHSYAGQEAIQVGCLMASSAKHWYTTTYRCHALAYLLGATPREIMAELYGKATGNAGGRGGSMHLYAERLLGGVGIVGGHVPLATGAAFSIKYQKQAGLVSFCFLGDGAFAQGAVHESLNMASLWKLPCIYVIENNQWGMGTSVKRAICVEPIAEHFAPAYDIKSYSVDGMNLLATYAAFQDAVAYVLKEGKPVLMEAVTERFRGHSISDPAFYRTKEELQHAMERDPILLVKKLCLEQGWLTEEGFKALDKQQREIVLDAVKFAEESPDPDPIHLEEGVYADPTH